MEALPARRALPAPSSLLCNPCSQSGAVLSGHWSPEKGGHAGRSLLLQAAVERSLQPLEALRALGSLLLVVLGSSAWHLAWYQVAGASAQ